MSTESPLSIQAVRSDELSRASLLPAVLESISDALFVVEHPSRAILFCNSAATEMFGYQRDDLLGSDTRPLHVDEASYERFGREYPTAIDERGVYRGEFRMKRADGSIFPTEHVVNTIGDQETEPSYLVSVVRDISRQKRHEQNLELVHEIRDALACADSVQLALRETLADFGRHTDCRYGEVWRPNEEATELVLEATWSPGDDAGLDPSNELSELKALADETSFSMEEGLPGRAWTEGEPVWVPDVADSSTFRRSEAADRADLHSSIALPVDRNGDPVAVLIWYADRCAPRDPTTVKLAETIARRLGMFLRERDIEEALRRERNRFEQMADNVDEVFWLSSPDKSEMLYINPAYERIWGRPREALYDEPTRWLEAVHPEDRDRVRESLDQQSRGEYEQEYRIQRPDGEVRWIRDRAYPVRDEEGEVVRIAGIAHDVTEQKRARYELEKSEEKFATAFQVNPHSMTIVTLEEQRFVEVNDGFREMFGYGADEVLGRRVSEFDLWVDPNDQQRVLAHLEAEGQIDGIETQFRTADGEVVDTLYSSALLELNGETCVLAIVQDISRRKSYERQLEHRALHDSLTDLPNRRLFRDRLDHALDRPVETDEQLAVIFLDIDRFKVVNDTLGHSAGDQLLKRVADRLAETVDKGVTVARFGGDEFVVLVEQLDGPGDARHVAGRLVEAVEQPCTVGGTDFHPSVSVGIAISDRDTRDADDLLRYADIALYESKSDETSDLGVYDAGRHRPETRKLHHENELRKALDRRDFTVHYQPIVDLESREVLGAEALARWEHPEEGLISPGTFIPVAEETGLIVPLGYQILEQATATVADWLPELADPASDRNGRLTVNLSAHQYRADGLVSRIRQIAEDHDFPLDQLVLEITESILMTGHGRLERLRNEGLRVAIDDFGTGYSSLQYLRQLDADSLKIDRSFVTGLDGAGRERVLIDAVLRMAEQFGMSVVAEGIETEEQLRHLRDLGGQFGQGFYFARPMPAEQFAATCLDR